MIRCPQKGEYIKVDNEDVKCILLILENSIDKKIGYKAKAKIIVNFNSCECKFVDYWWFANDGNDWKRVDENSVMVDAL